MALGKRVGSGNVAMISTPAITPAFPAFPAFPPVRAFPELPVGDLTSREKGTSSSLSSASFRADLPLGLWFGEGVGTFRHLGSSPSGWVFTGMRHHALVEACEALLAVNVSHTLQVAPGVGPAALRLEPREALV